MLARSASGATSPIPRTSEVATPAVAATAGARRRFDLKKDAPPEVVETLRQAEARADECWRGLQIRYYPSNVARWALLAGGIRAVEHEQAARGSNTPHFGPMMIHVSRALAVAVKWRCGTGSRLKRL